MLHRSSLRCQSRFWADCVLPSTIICSASSARPQELSGAVPAKGQDVTALLGLSIARGERHDLTLLDKLHLLVLDDISYAPRIKIRAHRHALRAIAGGSAFGASSCR